MALFENFPYTNFHDLNLDWIIEQFKNGMITIEEMRTAVEAMGLRIDEFQQYLDNIEDEIEQKIQTEVPIAIREEIESGGFNQLLSESHKRRIVFIGDSYGTGWTPDGTFTAWPVIVKNNMGLADADFINSSYGGAGFGKSPSDGELYIPNRIQYAYNNISNPETITDIVIGLGYNDHIYYTTPSVLQNGIITACAKSKQLFPNARIHIFAIGFTTNRTIQSALRAAYNAYAQTTADAQFYNICKSLSTIDFFSSDGIHPLQPGQNAIALNVLRILNNSEPKWFTPDYIIQNDINLELEVGNDPQSFNGMIYGYAYKGNLGLSNTVLKVVTLRDDKTFNLTGQGITKLAKVTQIGNQTGWGTATPLKWQPAKFYCSTTGTTVFTTYDVEICIASDMANNDSQLYMWVRLLGTQGGGFLNLSNIWRFGIMGYSDAIPFITEQ